jgi:hypothetical protein
MNICKRPVYQKGAVRKSRGKARPPTAAEIRYRERVRAVGCIVGPVNCSGYTTIHHCGTGAGGRKNHKKILPLCVHHHLGDEGINSQTGKMSRREWEDCFGSEPDLLAKLNKILGGK